MAFGSPAAMPAKMISEMPLPMPRSVICSPSHITKTVPAVSVIAVMILKAKPGLVTTPDICSRPAAMPNDWISARMTVA